MKYFSVATLEIEDFEQFKAEVESIHDTLLAWGLKSTCVNRDLDNPNRLIIVHEIEDVQKARQFYQSEEFRQCAQKAGVTGRPEVTFVEELLHTPESVHA